MRAIDHEPVLERTGDCVRATRRVLGAPVAGVALAVLALVACQDANRIEPLHDVAAAPRVFSWKLVTETAEMSDGVFVSNDEAWVVGPYGTILHTTNGGAAQGDWKPVESNTTSQLFRIAVATTPGGSFALVTGAGVVLRYSSEQPSWEPIDINPTVGKRPSLHVTADGHVEAWLATIDGFAYTADARAGRFTKAEVPPGATGVIFSDDGDSWALAPVGSDCVPYRKVHGEVDWHPVPVPPRAPVLAGDSATVSPRVMGVLPPGAHARSKIAHKLTGYSRAQACTDAALGVTLQRKKLWFVAGDEMSEWDGKAWISYDYPADLPTLPVGAPPAGSISDIIDGVELVLLPNRQPPAVFSVPPPPPSASGSDAALRKDPHDRAVAVWMTAHPTRFSVADLWMRDQQIWAVGRDGFVNSPDGGQTWTVTKAEPPAPTTPTLLRPGSTSRIPSGPAKVPDGMSLRKVAFNDRATQGWAVSDDGEVFHYDGSWHSQFKIDAMHRALALSLSGEGTVAWLLTRNALYRMTTARSAIVASDDRDSMEMLLVCPDGHSGWARYGGYHWYSYDGTAWTKVSARPSPACISASCATALTQAEPDGVVCASGNQIWSLRQGQTSDGATWQYPIPGLEPLQSVVAQLRADGNSVPKSMFAVGQDGTLLRTDHPTDQPSVIDPRAALDGSRVVLSWRLSGPSSVPPIWLVEHCVVSDAGICALDSAWVVDNGIQIQQEAASGKYLATVEPSKLSLKPDTKVQYRVRVTLGDLVQKPMAVAEVTLGESFITSVWGIGRPYIASVALWFFVLLAVWLIAPHVLLNLNDVTQQWVTRIPVLGNAAGSFAGVVLARRLVRTRRAVNAWVRRELHERGRSADATTGTTGGTTGGTKAEIKAEVPAGFKSISDVELRKAFQAMPPCQRAWIALHGERAAKAFESSKFAMERSAYGEVRARVLVADNTKELPKGVGLEDMRELVAPVAADPKLVLWIYGQGGVGKSTLACRIVRWLAKQALLAHPAIVVVIDSNAETMEALDAKIRERLESLTQATDIDGNLISNLLASGHLVLLFDGLTERSPKTIETVKTYLESPQAPALTICTARAPHEFTARRIITISPLPLDSEELLPFLSSYRRSLPADQRKSEDLMEPVRKAAKLIADGERRTLLTPLLVTLLWNEAAAGAPLSSIAVEAFNSYVARALIPTSSAADVAEQRRLALVRARLLGRLALGKNYRPGRWFTRDAAANSLRAANVLPVDHDVLHDFTAAGLLEEDSPDGNQMRFLIDPLSEYLCALSILYSYDGNDPEWVKFLGTLDALSPEERVAADGFLVALSDCWAAYGATLQLTSAPKAKPA